MRCQNCLIKRSRPKKERQAQGAQPAQGQGSRKTRCAVRDVTSHLSDDDPPATAQTVQVHHSPSHLQRCQMKGRRCSRSPPAPSRRPASCMPPPRTKRPAKPQRQPTEPRAKSPSSFFVRGLPGSRAQVAARAWRVGRVRSGSGVRGVAVPPTARRASPTWVDRWRRPAPGRPGAMVLVTHDPCRPPSPPFFRSFKHIMLNGAACER